MYRLLTLIVFAACSSLLPLQARACGEDKKNALDEFMVTSSYQRTMCMFTALGAIAKVEMGQADALSEIAKCRDEGRAELKQLFPKARAMVAKNPSALKLLKEFYAASIVALDDMYPDLNLPKIDYERRQSEDSHKLDVLQNQIEIEAGL